jgi:two-component system OmpR family response regulator
VLSALGEVDDKVDLLDLGADDYLTKPFSMRELSARIRASVRHGAAASHVITVGDLSLDTRTRVARRYDLSADLPSREFALLEYLMRHAGQVVTRQQLLDAVWGFDFDTGSNVVDVYVGYLRRKLDGPGHPSIIETVRGAGYRVPA